MAKVEILEEWFFPAAVKKDNFVVPAPSEALEKRDELRNGWLAKHRQLFGRVPSVSLSPGEKDGETGYFVREEIIDIGYSKNDRRIN